MKLSVKPVVCDTGIYVDDKLVLILNSRKNALAIANILFDDEIEHKRLNSPAFWEYVIP